MRLHGHQRLAVLESAVGRHVRPVELAMTACSPAAVAWVPQLAQCTLTVRLNGHLAQLVSGLEAAASLTQLSRLRIDDVRPPTGRMAMLLLAPGLEQLPALSQLVRAATKGRAAGQCPVCSL